MNTLLIVLPILTVLMFDLGLTLRLHDFSLVLQHPKPVLIALFESVFKTRRRQCRSLSDPHRFEQHHYTLYGAS